MPWIRIFYGGIESFGNVVLPEFAQALELFSLNGSVTVLVASGVLEAKLEEDLGNGGVVDHFKGEFLGVGLLEVSLEGVGGGLVDEGGDEGEAE